MKKKTPKCNFCIEISQTDFIGIGFILCALQKWDNALFIFPFRVTYYI